jgi:hypothetical protein
MNGNKTDKKAGDNRAVEIPYIDMTVDLKKFLPVLAHQARLHWHKGDKHPTMVSATLVWAGCRGNKPATPETWFNRSIILNPVYYRVAHKHRGEQDVMQVVIADILHETIHLDLEMNVSERASSMFDNLKRMGRTEVIGRPVAKVKYERASKEFLDDFKAEGRAYLKKYNRLG